MSNDKRLRRVWHGMKSRCNNPENKSYKNYGGRGIRVCEEWEKDFNSFKSFALSHGYNPDAPPGKTTIERIDVNKNYEPQNCTFVDRKAQGRNKRNNHCITYKGETKTISEFAEIYNLKQDTLYSRINVQELTPRRSNRERTSRTTYIYPLWRRTYFERMG